jgi:hypothetical protein
MSVAVMNVREVRMFVCDCHMPVDMNMWFLPVPREVVLVPVMFVV